MIHDIVDGDVCDGQSEQSRLLLISTALGAAALECTRSACGHGADGRGWRRTTRGYASELVQEPGRGTQR